MGMLGRNTTGVIPIVPTPFTDKGEIAYDDIGRLVDYYEKCGVVGLTILGVMGEADKLTWEETLAVVRAYFKQAAGRLPVIVGATSPSLRLSAELGRIAVSEGAAGVMLQPMSGLKTDAAVVDYYKAYAELTAGSVPICVQDFPQSSGVNLTLPAWCEISRLEPVFMLKHEPPAGLQKLSGIRAAEKRNEAQRVSILTSNNAMHLPQELQRGADGAMVGVAFTDIIVRVVRLHLDGQLDAAEDLYDLLLPLIRHETQGMFGLAIRKEILRRRGALTHANLRYPGASLTEGDREELVRLLDRFRTRAAAKGIDILLDVVRS